MMRASRFRYHPVRSIEQATHILAAEGSQAMLLAGGTDLIPNMKRRQQTPAALIALRRVAELRGIAAQADGSVVIGACTTLADVTVAPAFGQPAARALVRAAVQVATPPIRNAATLGGNLCLDTRCNYYNQNYEWRKAIDFCLKAPRSARGEAQRKPADGVCWVAPGSERCWAVSSTDTAPALIALGAEVELRSRGGKRRLPLRDLYLNDGMAYLAKQPDELLTAVHVPRAEPGARSTYWKLRRRGSFDFPVLSVAAMLRLGRDRVVESARVVLGSVASCPVVVAVETLLGKPLTDDAIESFAEAASQAAKPLDNTDFVMSWRKRVARQFLAGVLRELRGDDIASLGLHARRALAMNLPV